MKRGVIHEDAHQLQPVALLQGLHDSLHGYEPKAAVTARSKRGFGSRFIRRPAAAMLRPRHHRSTGFGIWGLSVCRLLSRSARLLLRARRLWQDVSDGLFLRMAGAKRRVHFQVEVHARTPPPLLL